jgi:hypothetical protein
MSGHNGSCSHLSEITSHDVRLTKLEQRMERVLDNLDLLPAINRQLGELAVSVDYIRDATKSTSGNLEQHLSNHHVIEVREAQERTWLRIFWPAVTLTAGILVGVIVKGLLGV